MHSLILLLTLGLLLASNAYSKDSLITSSNFGIIYGVNYIDDEYLEQFDDQSDSIVFNYTLPLNSNVSYRVSSFATYFEGSNGTMTLERHRSTLILDWIYSFSPNKDFNPWVSVGIVHDNIDYGARTKNYYPGWTIEIPEDDRDFGLTAGTGIEFKTGANTYLNSSLSLINVHDETTVKATISLATWIKDSYGFYFSGGYDFETEESSINVGVIMDFFR